MSTSPSSTNRGVRSYSYGGRPVRRGYAATVRRSLHGHVDFSSRERRQARCEHCFVERAALAASPPFHAGGGNHPRRNAMTRSLVAAVGVLVLGLTTITEGAAPPPAGPCATLPNWHQL